MTQPASGPIPDLPTDTEALRPLVLEVMAERGAIAAARDRLQADHDALAQRAERLEHLLRTLRRLQFGRKSERLPEEQLQLGLEDTEKAIAQVEAERNASTRRCVVIGPPSAAPIAAGCLPTSRASRWNWRRRTLPVHAAGGPWC